MRISNVAVFCVTCHLGCPVQKRKVQKTVDYIAVVFFLPHLAPCLNKLAFLLKARYKLICCQNGGSLCNPVPSKFVSGDARRRIQKAHIVMVNFYFVRNTLIKALYKFLRLTPEIRIACTLVSKPYFAWPEPASPLSILTLRVKPIYAGVVLAKACEYRNIPLNLLACVRKSSLHFLRRDARFFRELVHVLPHRNHRKCRNRFRNRRKKLHHASYPLIPDVAIPSTKNFCNERNTISTGISTTTLAAIIRPYSDEYCVMNMRSPI